MFVYTLLLVALLGTGELEYTEQQFNSEEACLQGGEAIAKAYQRMRAVKVEGVCVSN